MGRTVEYKVIQSQFTIALDRALNGQIGENGNWPTFERIAKAEETILNDLALDGWRLDHVSDGLLYLVREKPKLWNDAQVFVAKAECAS